MNLKILCRTMLGLRRPNPKPRVFLSASVMLVVCLVSSTLCAEITWQSTNFQYRIKNLSNFFYEPNEYNNWDNDDIILNESNATYDSVAKIERSEFFTTGSPPPGDAVVQMHAEAKGPEGGTDPPDGVQVRAFLDTVASGLDSQHGVDIDLKAVSRVIREFEVDQKENYRIRLDLSGLPTFDNFYQSDQHQAYYSMAAEVMLEQIVGSGDEIEIEILPGFPVELDEGDRTKTVAVQLRPFDDQQRRITYRIRTELELTSLIVNFRLQGFVVVGEINGTYQVGTAQAPIILQALLEPGTNANSAVNLLLLPY